MKSLYGLERLAVLEGGAWHYPQHDALGSVRQWTDAAAAVLAMQSYSPFGVPRAALAVAPWGFTGEWHDPGGLVYLRARWYNPSWGRFTQVDLVSGTYDYALGNPVLLRDPMGTDPPLPDPWPMIDEDYVEKEPYVRTPYGLLDLKHARDAYYNTVEQIWKKLESVREGGADILELESGPPMGRFVVRYQVRGPLSDAQFEQATVGIFQDFNNRLERGQGGQVFWMSYMVTSSFATEDLFSNSCGLAAKLRGVSLTEFINSTLGGGVPSKDLPWWLRVLKVSQNPSWDVARVWMGGIRFEDKPVPFSLPTPMPESPPPTGGQPQPGWTAVEQEFAFRVRGILITPPFWARGD